MTVVFLDLETTGLNPERNQLWEVGLIEEDGTEHLWKVIPDLVQADPDGLRISRFYERISEDEMRDLNDNDAQSRYAYDLVKNQDSVPLSGHLWSDPNDLADKLAIMLTGVHVIGACPWFDANLHGSFLSEFLRRYKRQLTCHYHLIDVETLAVGYLANDGGQSKSWTPSRLDLPWDSNELSRAVGVDPDQFGRHTALGDARWARAIYQKVMDQ